MAKKRTDDEVNLAGEMRDILRESPTFSGREAIAAIQAKFPRAAINKGSASVAFSNARRELGLSTGSKRRRSSGRKTVVQKRVPTAPPQVDLAGLQAAAKFVAELGSAELALEAVRQVKSLQIK